MKVHALWFCLLALSNAAGAQSIGLTGLRVGMTKQQTLLALRAAGLPTSNSHWVSPPAGDNEIYSELRVADPEAYLRVVINFGTRDSLWHVTLFDDGSSEQRSKLWLAQLNARHTGLKKGGNPWVLFEGCIDQATWVELRYRANSPAMLAYSWDPDIHSDCKRRSNQTAKFPGVAYVIPALDSFTSALTLSRGQVAPPAARTAAATQRPSHSTLASPSRGDQAYKDNIRCTAVATASGLLLKKSSPAYSEYLIARSMQLARESYDLMKKNNLRAEDLIEDTNFGDEYLRLEKDPDGTSYVVRDREYCISIGLLRRE